ncbi:DNA repair protein complementing XP-C cells isoform X2 [Amia ocellicauda]|uniref:DNA repair protein complementing XP-C cells isoform X2 n=1 Tax=Amia ocellicauda TaxID=2972642 RepID=UPI003464CA38
MAKKRKGSVDIPAKTDTKRSKQVTKGTAVKKPGKKRLEDAGTEGDTPAKKKKINSKVSETGNTPPKQSRKYFRDRKGVKAEVKEEPVDIKDDHYSGNTRQEQCTQEDRAWAGLQGEGAAVKKEEEEDDSDEEWEDVEELSEPVGSASSLPEPVLPSQPVEIEIETPEQAKKRQRREKREAEFETYLRRMMNRFNKDVIVDTHKVHLLCLLGNGFYRNRLCSKSDLQAMALSVLPDHLSSMTPEKADIMFLANLVKWFASTFTLNPDLSYDESESRQSVLERRFGMFSARDHEEMTHLFLIILRALQLFCRLVLSLQPIHLRGPPRKGKPRTSSSASLESQKSEGKTKKRGKKTQAVETVPEDENNNDETKDCPAGTKRPAGGRARMGKGTKKRKAGQDAGSDCSEKQEMRREGLQKPKNDRRRRVASKVSYKEDSEGEDDSASEFELSGEEDSSDSEGEEGGGLRRSKGKGQASASQTKNSVQKSQAGKSQKKRSGKTLAQKQTETLSSGDEDVKVIGVMGVKGSDQWLEVYLEKVGKWVCLDCVKPSVGQLQHCYKQATKPVTYIIGIDNDGFVKDLTKRYDPAWMTNTRKRRVDVEWWEETLLTYRSPFTEREKKEDIELQAKLLDQPLPTAISEYKNHPLYALKRHLLKYEAIYPSTAATLGYCRGEAVYSRDCVHTLHSKDTWLKEARVVRLGEVPYKMVKGFSNRARKARILDAENRDKDDLPLFGRWQTEEYQPPVAVEGKVPRNDYGNVYLFRPCMLPIGCVHMRVPNLHRVARKLGIDCAPAVTGFDFHCGFSHPVVEGYIVCEEYQEVLMAAWENEQADIEKKEREKREKKVLANWKLLVKGLLIRERLKRRYGQQSTEMHIGEGDGFSSEEEEDKEKEAATGSPTVATDLTHSWPQNRQAGPEEGKEEGKIVRKSKRERRGQQKHLFPFEKT